MRSTALYIPSSTRRWRNWQTRELQVLVSERTWGFESPPAHTTEP
jgi:hypothetical protein